MIELVSGGEMPVILTYWKVDGRLFPFMFLFCVANLILLFQW